MRKYYKMVDSIEKPEPQSSGSVECKKNREQKKKRKIGRHYFMKKQICTILENVGMAGGIKTETKAILMQNCLDVSPFEEQMKQYFPKDGTIKESEYEYRLDLRKECVFTIDPLTARDLDDAVSCKELPNGTPLDEIVAEKGTSVYMVQSVYHMLPKELCMICSLLPGEDKLAFSVFWEMTPDDKIPEDAQLPTIHGGFKSEDLKHVVLRLQNIALNLREGRLKGDSVVEIAANCNKQKFNAKRAGEQSIELYLIHYIDLHQPVVEKAVVMDVKDNSFDAVVISTGYNVRIYLNNLEENVKYEFLCNKQDKEDNKLRNLVLLWPEKNGLSAVRQIIAMFSIITVTLTKKEKSLKLEAKLGRPDNIDP
ncbi:Dis3 like 3'-5' exoribonuclease 2 [Carabus blaptoides fortunei]